MHWKCAPTRNTLDASRLNQNTLKKKQCHSNITSECGCSGSKNVRNRVLYKIQVPCIELKQQGRDNERAKKKLNKSKWFQLKCKWIHIVVWLPCFTDEKYSMDMKLYCVASLIPKDTHTHTHIMASTVALIKPKVWGWHQQFGDSYARCVCACVCRVCDVNGKTLNVCKMHETWKTAGNRWNTKWFDNNTGSSISLNTLDKIN